MRKILIIGCGLMFAQLSAMSLPDNLHVVHHEKFVINAPELLFADSVLLVDDLAVSEFVVQPQSTIQLQTFDYVNCIDVMNATGFYKPIDYENQIKVNPYDQYDIDKSRDSFKDEFQFFSFLKKENIPRSSLF